jgi:hypothetical protein
MKPVQQPPLMGSFDVLFIVSRVPVEASVPAPTILIILARDEADPTAT